MHEPINQFPKGTVLGSCRLAKGNLLIDLTRLKHGSGTRFVESITHQTRFGPLRTALRRTDDFPSDKIADRFIREWLSGAIQNRRYKLVHKDAQFDHYEEPRQEANQPS